MISKTAVAKRINALEAILRLPLLDRSPRGVTPTDAGLRLVPGIEHLLAETERTLGSAIGRGHEGENSRISGLASVMGKRAPSAERMLADTERLFADVFHLIDEGIVIFEPADYRVIEVNDAYTRLIGYDRSELIGQTGDDVQIFSLRGADPNPDGARRQRSARRL